MELLERFMENVNKDTPLGCWEWKGNKDRDGYGYGYIDIDGSRKKVHRLAYELFFGSIPEGISIYHTCNNPLCVNPDHLLLGTKLDRLMNKIYRNESNECWEWMGSKRNGYGFISINNHIEYTHRISYELFIGKIPEDMCVLHRCDNPPCNNPDHLFLGTKGDNIRDCISKGRNNVASGEKSGRAKLTFNQVRKIRFDYKKGGISQRELAKIFGVGKTIIGNIVRNESWKELL